MKTIDFSYFMERYNAGEMNQTEVLWFEKELEGNELLQKELVLRRKADKILERQDIVSLRSKLAAIEKSRREEPVKATNPKSPRFRYAAVLIGLVALGSILFFTYRTQSPETLYQKYYQAYVFPNTSRSAETTFDAAIDNFNKGEFSKAREGFQTYLKSNPASSKIEFLSGVSNMELNNFPEAKKSFNKVINREVNFYTEQANWYLALCYIATHEKSRAKDQLLNITKSESAYRSDARKILRHL